MFAVKRGFVVSNLFKNNAAGDTGFSFERHCAMKNSEEAVKVQNLSVVSSNSDLCCFTGKVRY